MKVVGSPRPRREKRYKVTVKGPDGSRMSMREFFESLPKGTVIRIYGKEFTKKT